MAELTKEQFTRTLEFLFIIQEKDYIRFVNLSQKAKLEIKKIIESIDIDAFMSSIPSSYIIEFDIKKLIDKWKDNFTTQLESFQSENASSLGVCAFATCNPTIIENFKKEIEALSKDKKLRNEYKIVIAGGVIFSLNKEYMETFEGEITSSKTDEPWQLIDKITIPGLEKHLKDFSALLSNLSREELTKTFKKAFEIAVVVKSISLTTKLCEILNENRKLFGYHAPEEIIDIYNTAILSAFEKDDEESAKHLFAYWIRAFDDKEKKNQLVLDFLYKMYARLTTLEEAVAVAEEEEEEEEEEDEKTVDAKTETKIKKKIYCYFTEQCASSGIDFCDDSWKSTLGERTKAPDFLAYARLPHYIDNFKNYFIELLRQTKEPSERLKLITTRLNPTHLKTAKASKDVWESRNTEVPHYKKYEGFNIVSLAIVSGDVKLLKEILSFLEETDIKEEIKESSTKLSIKLSVAGYKSNYRPLHLALDPIPHAVKLGLLIKPNNFNVHTRKYSKKHVDNLVTIIFLLKKHGFDPNETSGGAYYHYLPMSAGTSRGNHSYFKDEDLNKLRAALLLIGADPSSCSSSRTSLDSLDTYSDILSEVKILMGKFLPEKMKEIKKHIHENFTKDFIKLEEEIKPKECKARFFDSDSEKTIEKSEKDSFDQKYVGVTIS